MLHGFDVSGYNPTTVRKCNFVFVKASEGKAYRSGSFSGQWASAHVNADWRGGYHFARPEESSYKDQADRFMDIVQPQPGEGLCLDLEASKLTQSATNTWARSFGDRLRDKAPGVTTVAYFGSGYAGNGTGRNLKDHFDYWWYAQYPSAYQIAPASGPQIPYDDEAQRAANRSEAVRGRLLIAAMTTSWPSAVSPWLPSGLTCGWTKPDIWQFTDNWNGLDASISTLTLAQLAGAGAQPTPMEDDMIERELKPGLDAKTEFLLPPGKVSMFVANADNTYQNATGVKATGPVQIRVAIRKADGTWQSKTGTVGRAAADKTQPEFKLPLTDVKSTFVSVTRVDGDGTEPVVVGAY
jgi:hypothetical protein